MGRDNGRLISSVSWAEGASGALQAASFSPAEAARDQSRRGRRGRAPACVVPGSARCGPHWEFRPSTGGRRPAGRRLDPPRFRVRIPFALGPSTRQQARAGFPRPRRRPSSSGAPSYECRNTEMSPSCQHPHRASANACLACACRIPALTLNPMQHMKIRASDARAIAHEGSESPAIGRRIQEGRRHWGCRRPSLGEA